MAGIVSYAGLALLELLAGRTGLTARRSAALATPRLLVHDGAGLYRTWRARMPTAAR
jgi:hypothetical protein